MQVLYPRAGQRGERRRGSVIGQIYLGATVYVMPQFDAERVASIIDRDKITAIALARERGARTAALLGFDGGAARRAVDVALVVAYRMIVARSLT